MDTPKEVIPILGLATVDAMFGRDMVVAVSPTGSREKVITQFGDLDTLGVKFANELSVSYPVDRL